LALAALQWLELPMVLVEETLAEIVRLAVCLWPLILMLARVRLGALGLQAQSGNLQFMEARLAAVLPLFLGAA
jgi:hypothetical protein